ncbi:7026_t:CDS:1, partial [Racocetra persica]
SKLSVSTFDVLKSRYDYHSPLLELSELGYSKLIKVDYLNQKEEQEFLYIDSPQLGLMANKHL